jgi:hypothetical protein
MKLKKTAVVSGCCAIHRIAVKGVRKPTFKGHGTLPLEKLM